MHFQSRHEERLVAVDERRRRGGADATGGGGVAASCRAVENVEGGKVAFMFLTRGGMPLTLLWERFFYGQDRELFSIYHHTSPEYTEDLPQNSVFAGCRTPSKSVQWGSSSMIDAERRLLSSALLDPSNGWFVLLSESCIPLFNFTYIRDYLTGSRLRSRDGTGVVRPAHAP